MVISHSDSGSLTTFHRCLFKKEIILNQIWSPCTYKDNWRRKENFSSSELIALDVDEGCSIENFKLEGFEYLIATTRNHQKDKNGVTCDRFRVLIPLEDEVNDPDFYKFIIKEFVKDNNLNFVDPACIDSARMFYPSVSIVRESEGSSINPKEYEKRFEEYKAKRVRKNEEVQVSSKEKGTLAKATLYFLAFGAEPGSWNTSLYKAAIDSNQNGYTEEEFVGLAEKIEGYLDESSLKTIHSAFDREPTHPPRVEDKEDPIAVPASKFFDGMINYVSDKATVTGTPTLIPGLDRLMGGGLREGLHVWLAEAKTGKNSLFHQIMVNLLEGKPFNEVTANGDGTARGEGVPREPVGYASREISPDTEVLPNLLSIAFKKNAWLSPMDEETKIAYKAKLDAWQLYFAEGYGYFEPQRLKNWVRYLKDNHGVKIFFFDHLHYMLEDPEDFKSASILIREIKALTKELGVCINLIVQPTKLGFDQRLGLNSLRGGASIGQALDSLFLLERHKCNVPNVTKLTLDVARHKLCKTGHIYLQYSSETTIIEELEEEEAEVEGRPGDLVAIPMKRL